MGKLRHSPAVEAVQQVQHFLLADDTDVLKLLSDPDARRRLLNEVTPRAQQLTPEMEAALEELESLDEKQLQTLIS